MLVAPDSVPPEEQARYGALRLDAQGALSAFGNRSARWSPNRRAIVFLSNRDGAWKAYTAGWGGLNLPPTLVSGPPGPIVDADFHPSGTGILLAQAGGTLFLSDPETNTFRAWGPSGIRIEHTPLRASLSRSSIAIQAEEPRRVLLGTTESPAERTVPLNEAALAALSPGGQRLLAIEHPGKADARIVEIDGSNHRHVLVGPRDGIRLEAAAYAPDGLSVIYAEKMEGRPSRVLRLGKRGPSTVFEAPDPTLEIVQLVSSARSPSAAALTRSPSGMAVYLLQPSGYRKARKVGLPEGVGSLGAFSRDGRALTITWETPAGPSDIYEVTTDLGRLRKLRDDVRPTLAALDAMQWRRESIPSGDGAFEATVYEPAAEGPPAAPLQRAVVLLLGDEGPSTPAWRPSIRFLVGTGLVIVEPRVEGGAQSLSAIQVTQWLDAMDGWLPTQSWWAEGKRAVIGRADACRHVLDALGRTPSPWVTVCSAPTSPADWQFEGSSLEAWDMMLSGSSADAGPLVNTLREAGARVEYAVSEEPSARLAREALFLQRAFGLVR